MELRFHSPNGGDPFHYEQELGTASVGHMSMSASSFNVQFVNTTQLRSLMTYPAPAELPVAHISRWAFVERVN